MTGHWKRGTLPEGAASRMPELHQLADLLTPHALRAIVTLGVPELIAAGTHDAAELARCTGANQRVLSAVLAYLTTKDVLHRTDDEQYTLTDLGELLLHDEPQARLHLDRAIAPRDLAYGGLLQTLRTGGAGYGAVFPGRDYWGDLAAGPEAGEDFDSGLKQWAEHWLPLLLGHRDFSTENHVVDIGGGVGVFVAGLLCERSAATASLVELPGVARQARELAEERGVADRLTVVEQSFFEPLPEGGDVYLLAQVLHDWQDEECLAILRGAASAAAPDGRVLVVERLLDEVFQSAKGLAFHLQMLVTFGSGERSEEEFVALAGSAGLRHLSTTEIGAHLWVLEFAPLDAATRADAAEVHGE